MTKDQKDVRKWRKTRKMIVGIKQEAGLVLSYTSVYNYIIFV